ncbi:MAG: SulP family inorganic anion transporter [Dehalococcoidia bacterium]
MRGFRTVTGRVFAKKNGYTVEANQEMVATGMANLASGLFQGFPAGASQSRTVVNDAVGGRTPVVQLLAAGLLVLLLLFFTTLLKDLPAVALGAVIIVAASGLIEREEVRRLLYLNPVEGALAVGAMVGVLLLGVLGGTALAVVVQLGYVLWLLARPHLAVLGREPGGDAFHEISGGTVSQAEPGLIVFRMDGPIFFANSNYFLEQIQLLLKRPGASYSLVLAQRRGHLRDRHHGVRCPQVRR